MTYVLLCFQVMGSGRRLLGRRGGWLMLWVLMSIGWSLIGGLIIGGRMGC